MEQREDQRGEQTGAAPGTAGPTSIIDHEKQPLAPLGRPGGSIG
jgi:hypothetical protein